MTKATFRHDAADFAVEVKREGENFTTDLSGRSLSGEIEGWNPPCFTLKLEGKKYSGEFFRGKNFVDIHLPEGNFRLKYATTGREGVVTHVPGELTAPMPGKILKVFVAPGDEVQPGQTLMILEAMKMEHKIVSPLAGVVKKILFKEGDRVGQDVELVEIGEK